MLRTRAAWIVGCLLVWADRGADLQVCAGPPGPALCVTDSATSEYEEADVDVGRRTGAAADPICLGRPWGRPPGLRGSSRTRSLCDGFSHLGVRRGRRGRWPQDWSPAPPDRRGGALILLSRAGLRHDLRQLP